jgi:hypothetical protein
MLFPIAGESKRVHEAAAGRHSTRTAADRRSAAFPQYSLSMNRTSTVSGFKALFSTIYGCKTTILTRKYLEERPKNMKQALFFVILFMLASVAGAEPLCQTGSLDAYLAEGYACQVGDLIFSNFGYTPTGNPSESAVPATSVAVNVISQPGNVGFMFNGGWAVASEGGVGRMLDSLVTFDVTGRAITSMHLWFNGADLGTGLAEVVETYCLGDTQSAGCAGGTTGQLHVSSFGTGTFSQNLTFDPVTIISVSKDINVTSGADGTASISQVINTFDYGVPEPLSLLLCATGLFALGFLRRRK